MDTTQISRRQILVVGSCNTDMVIKAAHLPRPGETILGGTFFMNPGGKGANQAVAIARLGGSVIYSVTSHNNFSRRRESIPLMSFQIPGILPA